MLIQVGRIREVLAFCLGKLFKNSIMFNLNGKRMPLRICEMN